MMNKQEVLKNKFNSQNFIAKEEFEKEFNYELEDDKITITKGKNKKARELVIPSSVLIENKVYFVTKIGEKAFLNYKILNSVVLPDTLNEIGALAFQGCVYLKNLTLPNSVALIGKNAFISCTRLTIYSSLKSKPIRWDDDWNSGVPVYFDVTDENKIEIDGAIYVIQNNEAIITRLLSDVKSFEIPSFIEVNDKKYNVTSIGNRVFYGCVSLTSIKVPSCVKTVYKDSFEGCICITIYCEAKSEPLGWESNWNHLNVPVFFCVTNDSLVNIDGVTYVLENEGATVTKYDGEKVNLKIPNTINVRNKDYKVIRLAKNVFCNFKKVLCVTIPKSVLKVDERVFFWCESAVIYCEGSIQKKYWNNADDNYVLYSSYSGIIGIRLPVYYDVNNDNNVEIDGFNYVIKDDEAIVSKYIGKSLKVNIPEIVIFNDKEYKVTSIGENAFFNNKKIYSVFIPDSVISIGENAFLGCKKLKNINIPNKLTYLGKSAFQDCFSLKNITLPKTLEVVDEKTFYDCRHLASVTFSNGLKAIESEAFVGCVSLTSIDLPKSVKFLGHYAFFWCDALKSVTIPFVGSFEGATKDEGMMSYVFSGTVTNNLEEVNILEGSKRVENKAFWYFVSLKKINIPSSIVYIGSSAFQGCTSLTNITIPSNVKYIGKDAFFDCNLLTIDCEDNSQISNWDKNWNSDNCIVNFKNIK